MLTWLDMILCYKFAWMFYIMNIKMVRVYNTTKFEFKFGKLWKNIQKIFDILWDNFHIVLGGWDLHEKESQPVMLSWLALLNQMVSVI